MTTPTPASLAERLCRWLPDELRSATVEQLRQAIDQDLDVMPAEGLVAVKIVTGGLRDSVAEVGIEQPASSSRRASVYPHIHTPLTKGASGR